MTPTKRPNLSKLRLDIQTSTILSRFYRAKAARALYKSRKARAKGKTYAATWLLRKAFEMRNLADDGLAQRHRLTALAILKNKPSPCNLNLIYANGLAPHLFSSGLYSTEADALNAAKVYLFEQAAKKAA